MGIRWELGDWEKTGMGEEWAGENWVSVDQRWSRGEEALGFGFGIEFTGEGLGQCVEQECAVVGGAWV